MATRWACLMGRLLLVLGLVAGPWPAAMAASVSHAAPAMQSMSDEAPCPMEQQGTPQPSCPCCDDGAACNAAQCVASTPAPGLPLAATSFNAISDGALHDADDSTRSPEPRPRERLRPPIA